MTAAVVAVVVAWSGLSPTPAPTPIPTAIPAPSSTAAANLQPTPAPTTSSTAAPTQQPTATPTHQPAAAPTQQPAATPTQQPAATPTEQPAAAPAATTDDGPGTAFGTVTAASPDGDPTKNRALVGVTVTAYEFATEPNSYHEVVVSTATTVTDAAGHYHFSGLPPEVHLKFDAPDVFGRPSSRWFREADGGVFLRQHGAEVYTDAAHNAPHDEAIPVPAIVSGSVLCSGCSLPDPSQLEVHLMARDYDSTALSRATVHPDASGHFSFSDVLPWDSLGGYSLSVAYTGPGTLPPTSNGGDFVVGPGQTVSKNVTIRASDPASPVVHGTSADGVQLRGTATVVATSAHPASIAAGGVVSLYDFAHQDAGAVASATTDATGRYAIDGLAAGPYLVKYEYTSASGSTSAIWLGQDEGRVPQPLPLVVGAFAVYDPKVVYTATITGRISCERCSSPPPPGTLTIELRHGGVFDDIWETVSDTAVAADGSFRFENVYPGENLDLRATYGGQISTIYPAANSASFSIGESGTAQVDVLLPYSTPFDYRSSSHIPEVYALYDDYLGRLPSTRDAEWWAARLDAGTSTTSSIAQAFVESDEYRLIRIDAAYQSILGRGADAPGRANWLRAMQAGVITTDDIETSFYASDEWFRTHGDSNGGFVRALYTTLLDRTASAADVSFWGALVSRHGRAWVIDQFWDSAETIGGRVSAMYNTYLGRIPDPAGLASWVGLALAIGDSGLRAGLTSSAEYLARAHLRYVNG